MMFNNLFDKPNIKRTIVVLLVVGIIISSFWYLVGGRCQVRWYDKRPTQGEDFKSIIIKIDGKIIAVSDGENFTEAVNSLQPGLNTKEIILSPGKHTLKLLLENKSLIDEYKFTFTYNLYVHFIIFSNYNISFRNGHFNKIKYSDDGFFIGLTNSQLILYVASVVVLCLLTFKYWKRSVQKEEQKNLELENEKGKNNESNSKNKGG